MKFRNLRADEIDCRVAQTFTNKDNTIKGLTLLLYKDARCDMNVLDESGVLWQRKHYECKGNLFCSVGILTDGEWIWKDDCGSESYTEKEKGEASDSFKRACVNWGIGRELYTAPLIYIPITDQNGQMYFEVYDKNGKWQPKATFAVSELKVEDGKITHLTIINPKLKVTVFDWSA